MSQDVTENLGRQGRRRRRCPARQGHMCATHSPPAAPLATKRSCVCKNGLFYFHAGATFSRVLGTLVCFGLEAPVLVRSTDWRLWRRGSGMHVARWDSSMVPRPTLVEDVQYMLCCTVLVRID